MSRDVLLAAVIGAHGLKGEVKVKTFTETPEALARYKRLHAKKIKVIGATVVSSFGSPIGSDGFPEIDAERKKINDFI